MDKTPCFGICFAVFLCSHKLVNFASRVRVGLFGAPRQDRIGGRVAKTQRSALMLLLLVAPTSVFTTIDMETRGTIDHFEAGVVEQGGFNSQFHSAVKKQNNATDDLDGMLQGKANEGNVGPRIDASKKFFVILDTFRLAYLTAVHTEITFCDRSKLDDETVNHLTRLLTSPRKEGFQRIPDVAWKQINVQCESLWYGGNSGNDACSGIQGPAPTSFSRDSSESAKKFTAEHTAKKYIYGTSDGDGFDAYKYWCCGESGKYWSGKAYAALSNNCNTFTMRTLQCAVGLSKDLPSRISWSHGGEKRMNEQCEVVGIEKLKTCRWG